MSQKNDFKAFSISNNANVVSQRLYEESKDLLTGFPPNDVPTHLLNKALRQSSTISSVLADFISTQSGEDVLDDGDIAKLTAQLNRALEQKTTAKVPDASLTQKGVVQLTDVVGNSDTLAVTQKLAQEIVNLLREDINNRVPNIRKVNGKALSTDISLSAVDVGAYTKAEVDNRINVKDNKNTSSKGVNGWWKCGDTGVTCQWGYTKGNLGESREWVQFPIRFSNGCFGGLATVTLLNKVVGILSAYFGGSTQEGAWVTVDQATNTYDQSPVFWFAIGY
ncbi:tail fiber protein [Photorhabdus temperata]|uniref:Phage tail fiber n=1 Tax=Photorhabdus temperata subsp. temperata Meg1 TaxID=1393735 RepID=A0A081RUR6_PHOTE|nr:tail fiber protein [Photorhabdus temperata]KER02419.1 Phage tail fiber [Photorhabdus temperata subsp. temperata Meg1]MCT8348551.1 tail fiber protein [Photorhabdus temperata]